MQAKLSLLKNFHYEKNKQKNSKLKILFNLIIFVNQIIYQAKAMYQSCKLLSKKTISPFNTTDGKIRWKTSLDIQLLWKFVLILHF